MLRFTLLLALLGGVIALGVTVGQAVNFVPEPPRPRGEPAALADDDPRLPDLGEERPEGSASGADRNPQPPPSSPAPPPARRPPPPMPPPTEEPTASPEPVP
jgi:hypothetical protein